MRARLDLSGQRFGRLLVKRRLAKEEQRFGRMWLCVCDCGKEHTIATSSLTQGLTRSCGCLAAEGPQRSLKAQLAQAQQESEERLAAWNVENETRHQLEEDARAVYEAAMRPYLFGWFYCHICGTVFRPPRVHTAHPTCPVYQLQETLGIKLPEADGERAYVQAQ